MKKDIIDIILSPLVFINVYKISERRKDRQVDGSLIRTISRIVINNSDLSVQSDVRHKIRRAKAMTKNQVILFLATILNASFVTAAEYTDLGPSAQEAYKGMRRPPKTFKPDSEAPFFSVSFGGFCSPTYVTNDGYFLLALHCLSSCLEFGGKENNYGFNTLKYREVSEGGVKFGLIDIDVKKAKTFTCNIEGPGYSLNGYAANKESGLQARIVSLGAKGYIAERDSFSLAEKNPELFQSFVQKGYDGLGGAGDFALLKMEANITSETALPESASRPGHCLPLARSKANPGAKVWSLNFPALERLNRNTTYSPLVTAGQVLRRDEAQGLRPDSVEFAQDHQALTLDVDGGASGGSYFDERGLVRGILVVSVGSKTKYERGTTFGVNIEHILKHLRADLGDAHVEKILDGCRMTDQTRQLVEEIVQTPGD